MGHQQQKGTRRQHRPSPDEARLRDAVLRHFSAFQGVDQQLDGSAVEDVECNHMADVWGGMGTIYEVSVRLTAGRDRHVIAKFIKVPQCSSVGDVRKRDSYHIEANFFERGHAERLNRAGAACPLPLFIERSGDGMELILCMSRLEGIPTFSLSAAQADAALGWLATLHAAYWGARADDAVSQGGLQPQGCYWYLDTRAHEHSQMPTDGWQGRLRLAARGLDARLKADRYQTVVHGDAKAENMLFAGGKGGLSVSFCDFQYVGKAHPAKDLAYSLLCVTGDLDDSAQHALLERYLGYLAPLLIAQGDVSPDLRELQAAYGLCVCDLARWMSGWGWHGHEGIMRRRCKATLDAIDGGINLGSEEAYSEAIFAAFPL